MTAIRGTGGDDLITPEPGHPYTLYGDLIAGLGGDDTILASGGDDGLAGGPGHDSLVGGDGWDTLDGGAGNDTLVGSPAGGYWHDTLLFQGATTGVDVDLAAGTALDGMGGIDSIANFSSIVATGFGDTIRGNASRNFLNGGAGGDSLAGDTGDDYVYGEDGADALDGGDGDDRLYGDAGDDTLTGGLGFDLQFGGGGNDVLRAGDADRRANRLDGGEGDDALFGAAGPAIPHADVTILHGGPGDDTIDGQGNPANRVDLAPFEPFPFPERGIGFFVDLGTGRANFDSGAAIEVDQLVGVVAIRTGSRGDTLIGSDADEVFLPDEGSDLVNGSGGADRVSYATAQYGFTIDLGAGYADLDQWGGDTLIGIENATGTRGDDTILGDGRGNILAPLNGNDLVHGRGGEDWVDYDAWWTDIHESGIWYDSGPPTAGVEVDLVGQVATDNWGGIDRLVSIEHAIGSMHADTLTGALRTGDMPSYVRGLEGDDVLRAKRTWGGATADYAADPAGVRVNLSEDDAFAAGVRLAGGTARDGWGDMDTLIGMLRVRGSGFDDAMIGSAAADTLSGGDGDDTLRGAVAPGDGQDSLSGGGGADVLIMEGKDGVLLGGPGGDTLVLHDTRQLILGFQSGVDRIVLSAADFPGLSPGLDLIAAGRFVANEERAATSPEGVGQFVYDTDHQVLFWDGNGTAPGGAVLWASLRGGDDLRVSDIILIA